MKIVCISDSHCQLDKITIPDGDILVHSGDLTYRGTIQETSKELFELSKHRARFKNIVLVEGNHDWLGEHNPPVMDQMCEDNGITLLRDSSITIEGVKLYGAPWQPEFCNWAFNVPRGRALKEKWDLIPEDTNVLITHGPPHGILDGVERFNGKTSEYDIEHVGCVDLWNKINQLDQLKLHVFGHIHSGYGQIKARGITFINASTCTERYKPNNQPITIDV